LVLDIFRFTQLQNLTVIPESTAVNRSPRRRFLKLRF